MRLGYVDGDDALTPIARDLLRLRNQTVHRAVLLCGSGSCVAGLADEWYLARAWLRRELKRRGVEAP